MLLWGTFNLSCGFTWCFKDKMIKIMVAIFRHTSHDEIFYKSLPMHCSDTCSKTDAVFVIRLIMEFLQQCHNCVDVLYRWMWFQGVQLDWFLWRTLCVDNICLVHSITLLFTDCKLRLRLVPSGKALCWRWDLRSEMEG